MSRKLRVHYVDCAGDNVLAEVVTADYAKLLKGSSDEVFGSRFASQLDAIMSVINTKPSECELDSADIFVDYTLVKKMATHPAELYVEIPVEFLD